MVASEAIHPAKGTTTVMVVDDFDPLRQAVCRSLQARGLAVLSAASGMEALEMASQHRGQIDVLLTDLMMPEIQGHELAQAMLEVRPELRVIFMTGDASAARNLHKLPAIGPLLRKPFQTTRLIDTIRDLVGEAGAAGPAAAPPEPG